VSFYLLIKLRNKRKCHYPSSLLSHSEFRDYYRLLRLLEITGDYWRILFVDIGCRRQDIGYIPYDIQVAISHSCCRYGKYLYTVKLIGCSNTTVVDIEQIVRHYRQ